MIILVLLFGLLLRLINLNQSLWWDEGITFTAVSKYNLLDLTTRFPLGDFHPPLYYVLLMYWTKIFGYSEIGLRLPSVIFGVLLIWVVYLIGRKLFTHQIGLAAGLLTATSPLLIYYSQEARMYALDALIVCISMYFFILLINSNFKNFFTKTGFLLANIVLIYSDYIIYLVFPVQFIILVFFRREFVLRYLFLLSVVFIFLIPWTAIFITQMENGSRVREALPAWSHVVGGATFKEFGLLFAKTIFGRITFDNKIIYSGITLIGIICYGFLVALNFRYRNTYSNMLLVWLVLPVILAIFISLHTPIFSYFRMIFILPALYLLIGRGIYLLPYNLQRLTITVIVVISLGFVFIFNSTPRFQREDWRGAVAYMQYIQNLDWKNFVIIFENNTIPDVFSYYSVRSLNIRPGLKKIPVTKSSDVLSAEDFKGIDGALLPEYLIEITDRERILENNLYNSNFKVTGNARFSGVGVINIFQK